MVDMIMARQAYIETHGGPEVIQWHDVELAEPGPGEVRLRTLAAGLNYIDTYHRTGLYPVNLPSGLGVESASRIEAIGDGVSNVSVGDRVISLGSGLGAYCAARNAPADRLIVLPDAIDDETAAAIFLKGCTAEFLVERCAKVESGWPVLVYAAAGGTGQLLVQWLKHIGAEVIGVVSTSDKAQLAISLGADHVILHREEDIAARVREITGGRGVRVAFDGVGRATWQASLDAVGSRGLIVSYGNASGPVEGVNLGMLASKGSLLVTRPGMFEYYADPGEAAAGTARLFEMITSGALRAEIGQRYALEDAEQAHIDLENGQTIGASILLP
jgi:NADPH2:quinone reductase